MIVWDGHVHTAHSDGEGTPEQIVRAALTRGLSSVTVTEHGPRHFYGPDVKKLRQEKQEVERLKIAYRGKINVFFGVEADLIGLDGSVDITDEELSLFDELVIGFHRAVIPKDFSSALGLWAGNVFLKNGRQIARNTLSAVNAITRFRPSIYAHAGEYIPVELVPIAQAAVKAGTLIEINAHHLFPLEEQLCLAAKETDALFVLSSDAHRIKDAGVVDEALVLADRAGIDRARIVNLKENYADPAAPLVGQAVYEKYRCKFGTEAVHK